MEDAQMNNLFGKNGMLYPMLVIAAISAIVFSAFGVAMITGSLPRAEPVSTSEVVPSAQHASYDKHCAGCGVVESILPVEEKSKDKSGVEMDKYVTVRYQVRLRMQDGTYRASYLAAAPGFAVGDPVKVENGQIAVRR